MGRCVLRHDPIWGYTVCLCPIKRMAGLYELMMTNVLLICDFFHLIYLSHLMRKSTICICQTKGADQLRRNCEAISAFVFPTWIVQFIYFLNPKFPASKHPQCLYSSVCVGPVLKPQCWFSHKVPHFSLHQMLHYTSTSSQMHHVVCYSIPNIEIWAILSDLCLHRLLNSW